jgi:cardiolipin synthase
VGGVVVMALLGLPVAIRPLFVSKVNTVLQIVLVALTLFVAGFAVSAPAAQAALLALTWAVAATTLTSGAAYVWRSVWVR